MSTVSPLHHDVIAGQEKGTNRNGDHLAEVEQNLDWGRFWTEVLVMCEVWICNAALVVRLERYRVPGIQPSV